jgi:hypothetical protein
LASGAALRPELRDLGLGGSRVADDLEQAAEAPADDLRVVDFFRTRENCVAESH